VGSNAVIVTEGGGGVGIEVRGGSLGSLKEGEGNICGGESIATSGEELVGNEGRCRACVMRDIWLRWGAGGGLWC
jgi:hypothetical protein